MRIKYIIIALCLFWTTQLFSQQTPTLFKASSFSEAYFNPVYQELKQRKANNQFLSDKENKWLELYQSYIDDYFNLLNQNQQTLFHEKRTAIEFNKDAIISNETEKTEAFTTEKNERDTELLLGHILFSGVSGIVYGVQMNYIFDIESYTSSAGLTMLLSGGSMLIPVFSPRYDHINANSLWLRAHGKTMGGLYGYFFSAALFGDNIFETYDYSGYDYIENRNKKPFALTMSLLSSVSLGHLGFYLGNNKSWTDGRIATYQYYGYALPALSTGLYYSFTESSDIRDYGMLISASVPLGYYAAHQLANKIEYTRGDMTAIINNSVIGGMVGASVLAYGDFNSSKALLWPIAGGVLGSFTGHYTYKSFHISRQEGRRLNYATIGGGLIGLGVTFLADPEEGGTYFLVPALFGAIGYGSLLKYYYKQPRFTSISKYGDNIDFSIHPESFIINKHLPAYAQAPLFSMRIRL